MLLLLVTFTRTRVCMCVCVSVDPCFQSQSADVHALIERMQSGLDLKDIRAHEIMEIYEHELATCTVSVELGSSYNLLLVNFVYI